MTYLVSESLLLIVCVGAAVGGFHHRGKWRAFWIGVAIVCTIHIVQPIASVTVGIGLIDPWRFAQLWTSSPNMGMDWWHSVARTIYILTVSGCAGLLSAVICALAGPGLKSDPDSSVS
jgi:ABC-type Fe3+ transport system permease subunit